MCAALLLTTCAPKKPARMLNHRRTTLTTTLMQVHEDDENQDEDDDLDNIDLYSNETSEAIELDSLEAYSIDEENETQPTKVYDMTSQDHTT